MSNQFSALFRDLREGRVTRRDVAKIAGSLGLATVAMHNPRPVGAVEGEIPLYFTWTGYEIPELHQAYVDEHGGSPESSVFGDEEEALQKIRAGFSVDVAHPCVETMQKWYDAGILLPLDQSRLTYWDDMWPELQNMEGTHFDGELYFAATDWGNSSVLYRTDIVDTEESWYMLFDEKYAGRISPWNSNSNVYAAAAYLGLDMYNVSQEDLEGPVADLLRQQREVTRFYWDDPVQAEQAMATGEVVSMYAWNASLVNLLAQGIPVAYANPKEGIWTWCCGLSRISTGDGDEDLIYDFVNAWMTPESGAFLIDTYGYGHSNQKAFEMVPPERLDELGISSPSALFANGVFFKPLDPETENRYQTMWDEIISGM